MSFRMALRPLMVCSALFVFGHLAAAAGQSGGDQPAEGGFGIGGDQSRLAPPWKRVTNPGVTQIEQLDKEIAAIAQQPADATRAN